MAAAENSFDIVSKIEMPEVVNAIQQAVKEIQTRYDLKDSKSDIQLNEKDNKITLASADEYRLKAVRDILEGKRVVLIDDSLVRGTTSRKIVKMVRAAGAREVHVRISCPPTISPCFYGVDTPRRAELIAATHTLEEIRRYLNADSLAYLSLDGML